MKKLKLYSILSLISLVSCTVIGAKWTLFLLDAVYPLLRECFDKLDKSYDFYINPSTYVLIFLIPTAAVVILIYIAAEKIGGKLNISRSDFLKGFAAIPLAVAVLVFAFGFFGLSLIGVIFAAMCAVAYTIILLFCGGRKLIGKLLGKPDKTPCPTE